MNENNLSIEQIKMNYQIVQDRIRVAAYNVGRDPIDITLVAVTKGKSVTTIEKAIKAGMRIFGENYADEAQLKILALSEFSDIEWHMIGHVQSRKAKIVIEYFHHLHSLDSIKLAKRLDRYAGRFNKKFPVLLEFNLSGESSKFGFPAWREDLWMELCPYIEQILELPNIVIRGVMTIPPFSDDPEASRPYYQKLSRLRSFLQDKFTDAYWTELSMGMSSDFHIAIEEGATWIRIGQALLGPRD